jgi:hypothetical protein
MHISPFRNTHLTVDLETIPLDPWLSPPLRSATACSPANRRRRVSAARCGQPRIQDSIPPSIPLTGTDALAGRYGARSNCGESGRSASAHTKSNSRSMPCPRAATGNALPVGLWAIDEHMRPWSGGSRRAFLCGTSADAAAAARSTNVPIRNGNEVIATSSCTPRASHLFAATHSRFSLDQLRSDKQSAPRWGGPTVAHVLQISAGSLLTSNAQVA